MLVFEQTHALAVLRVEALELHPVLSPLLELLLNQTHQHTHKHVLSWHQ